MRTLLNLRASVIAIVATLAMLIVPACGSFCSAMTNCSSTAISPNSDSCHHSDMSDQVDAASPSISSPTLCNPQSPLLAILATSDSSIRSESLVAAVLPFSNAAPTNAPTLSTVTRTFFLPEDSPQQSIPLENLSILRI